MDDDPVLRALGAQLERDDPRLAALLGDGRAPRRRPWWLLFLAVPLVYAATLWAGPVVLGVTALVLGLAAPLAVGLWCLGREDLPTGREDRPGDGADPPGHRDEPPADPA